MLRKILIILAILVALFFLFAPGAVENKQNQVLDGPAWQVPERVQQFHDTLRVADLHADTLLWNRDFLDRGTRGHVDLPRLQEGNVVLQVMAAVTKTPRNLNYVSNSGDSGDNITLLAIVQLWPPRTWGSLLERAIYQSERLHKAADRSDALVVVASAAQLDAFLRDREADQVATILATEGAHPLEGEIDNLARLWDAGFRVLGLHHFFDNRLGGSLHGESRSGLTEFGRNVVRAAVDMGFIVDVAHSSPASVDDVLAINPKPVIVSHTGINGTCDSPRNLADEQMQRIAAAGGLIGVGYWDAVCDITPAGVAKSIRYAVDLVGVDHVALGSDYDGATTVAFDASDLAVLTQALLEAGLSEDDVRKVMGDNQLRFFSAQLP
ncbi:MAG: membrane dipeptidase [Woeseiaceae bacterium]|jgi:microsomal dipeptidase-like Zn-dependent dipeptidase